MPMHGRVPLKESNTQKMGKGMNAATPTKAGPASRAGSIRHNPTKAGGGINRAKTGKP